MQIIHQVPLFALGMGAAFTVLWGVADPVAAFAEVRMYTGVGKCAMGDLVSPAQAKNYAKELAMQNAKEQAGVYLTNYTRTVKAKLSAKEITAISNNITELVGEVKYTQVPTEADGVPVVVYTATLQANVDTAGIQKYLEKDEKEKVTIVSQVEKSQQDVNNCLREIEKLDEQYNKASSEQEKEKIRREFDAVDKKLLSEQKNKEGIALYYRGDYAGAERAYKEAIELDSQNAYPWNNLGFLMYEKHGDRNQALKYYRKAIELNPEFSSPWSNMGNIYCDAHEFDKAIEYYRKAVEINPQYAVGWASLGYACIELEKYETGAEYCRKATEIDPELAGAWSNLGRAYENMEEYDRALEYLNQALALDPKDASGWYYLGSAYNQMGNREKAIECYKNSIEINPQNVSPWASLGIVYAFGLKDYQKAMSYFNKACELAPKDMELREMRDTVEFMRKQNE